MKEGKPLLAVQKITVSLVYKWSSLSHKIFFFCIHSWVKIYLQQYNLKCVYSGENLNKFSEAYCAQVCRLQQQQGEDLACVHRHYYLTGPAIHSPNPGFVYSP